MDKELIEKMNTFPLYLHPMLKEALCKAWCVTEIDASKLKQGFTNKPEHDMRKLCILDADGKYEPAFIEVPSLRGLFRGTEDLGAVQEDCSVPLYMYMITHIEANWTSAVAQGMFPVPRDQEVHDFYSQLRRRPDGRQYEKEPMYKVLWQCFAFLACVYEISEANYTHCLTRLVHSASVFRTSIASCNMYANIAGVYLKRQDE